MIKTRLSNQTNIILARSERLYLTPMKVDHAADFVRWFNDPEVFAQMRDMRHQTTLDEQVRWILDTNRDTTQEVFSIFFAPEDRLIGDGGFINIHYEDRKAEIGLVIGEKEFWNRGLGAEAIWMLCRYGFDRLNFNNIMAEHYSINKKSLHLFQKVGFKYMGTRRQSKWLAGQWIDVHYSDLLEPGLIKPSPPKD